MIHLPVLPMFINVISFTTPITPIDATTHCLPACCLGTSASQANLALFRITEFAPLSAIHRFAHFHIRYALFPPSVGCIAVGMCCECDCIGFR